MFGNNGCGDSCLWIILILVLLLCCCGGFGSGASSCGNHCGCGDGCC